MVKFDKNKKIYLFNNDVSFRFGIDGLTNLVLANFNEEEVENNIYVFFNKNGRQVKILEFDKTGTWLYQNKLKDYRYSSPTFEDGKIQIDKKQLRIIFNNLEIVKRRSKKKEDSKITSIYDC